MMLAHTLRPFSRLSSSAPIASTTTDRPAMPATGSKPFLFLRGNETLGQLLENKKAENNDGGRDCQGDRGAPVEEESGDRANRGKAH